MSEATLKNIIMPTATSSELLAAVLYNLVREQHERTQVLVERGQGPATINKLRVALSRSRKRNTEKGKKIARFTLNHSIYPYTDGTGARFDAVVLSTQKNRLHRALELVDDMLDRDQLQGGMVNVA